MNTFRKIIIKIHWFGSLVFAYGLLGVSEYLSNNSIYFLYWIGNLLVSQILITEALRGSKKEKELALASFFMLTSQWLSLFFVSDTILDNTVRKILFGSFLWSVSGFAGIVFILTASKSSEQN